jgi:hypothetical protein
MARSSGAGGVEHEGSFKSRGYSYSITGSSLTIENQTYHPGFYVGSGTNARGYLLSFDGFLYEAPITWYARSAKWDLSPGYQGYSYPYLTRAIAPGCLECHASGVRTLAGTQNGYASPPFLEAGIACERCHGPGARHASSGRREDIVNPARLAGERRDSVCAQCHLSGDVRVERAGKHQHDFAPGDRLSDYSTAFVRAAQSPRMRVTSHGENLAQSACSRASGDRLWCGTCHDPHFTPSASEKTAWFRSKCQSCHAASQCSRGPDCIACHMPASSVADADHVVYTDHSIPRRALPRNLKPPADAPLVSFGTDDRDPRDLGLAYAILALRENSSVYRERAFRLLRDAEANAPGDPQTLAYLADLYKSRSDDRNARQRYEKLLQVDPTQSAAYAALGAYESEAGRYEEGIRLWREALRISPALVLVRYNLAVALIQTGRREEAREILSKALEFNPWFAAADKLLAEIRRTNE